MHWTLGESAGSSSKQVDLIRDAQAMATKYAMPGPNDATDATAAFRMVLLKEEFNETLKAFEVQDAEEFIDGHVDMLVVILGTLLHLGVDIDKAWAEVHRANMSKIRGFNPKRPESGGNDLYKPEGWQKPDHSDNHGRLVYLWNNK